MLCKSFLACFFFFFLHFCATERERERQVRLMAHGASGVSRRGGNDVSIADKDELRPARAEESFV